MNSLSSFFPTRFIPSQLSAFFSRDTLSSALSSLPFLPAKILQLGKEKFVHYYRNGGNKVALPLALLSLIGIVSCVAYFTLQKNPQSAKSAKSHPNPASFIANHTVIQGLEKTLFINCSLPKTGREQACKIHLKIKIAYITQLSVSLLRAKIKKNKPVPPETLITIALMKVITETLRTYPQYQSRASKASLFVDPTDQTEKDPIYITGNQNLTSIKTAYIAAMTDYENEPLTHVSP